MAAPFPSPVKHNTATIDGEVGLANAVLAINPSPGTRKLCNRDISFAVQKQFSLPRTTFTVSSFHSDFIIQLSMTSDRDMVLASRVLRTSGINMVLMPWSRTFKSKTVAWKTEVAVDITNIPPHACFVHFLEPMLLPHCTIESATFNRRKGACRVAGFASSVDSIPSHGYIGVQYPNTNGVSNDIFPVSLQAYPITMAPRFRGDFSPPQSPGSPESLTTAEEFGMDPDVLRKVYEQQDLEERAALNSPQKRRVCTHDDGYCSTDSSLFCLQEDDHGWESDRCWHY